MSLIDHIKEGKQNPLDIQSHDQDDQNDILLHDAQGRDPLYQIYQIINISPKNAEQTEDQ